MLLSLSYGLLTVYVIVAFIYGIKIIENKTEASGKITLFSRFIFFWCLYIVLITYSGFLNDTSFPPKMPLFIVGPIFFIMGRFLRSEKIAPFIEHIPMQLPYYFQSFRIFVELAIYGTFLSGFAPVYVTFEGYNYEIYGAVLFVLLGLLSFKYNIVPKKIAYFSNYLGLALLAFIVGVFISCIYFPTVWGESQSLISPEFISIPYMFLPGILMPAAVFMHLFAIKQYHYYLKNIEV